MIHMLKQTIDSIEYALKKLTDVNYALDESLIVAITDHKGTILFVNKKFCEISKYTQEELLGQNHRIINSNYHSKEFFKDLWRTIVSGKVWRGDIRNQAKDGTYYWMDTTIVPCLDENGRPYQFVSFRIDITNRKRTEEILRKSDKIAAVGQLASAIAYEIRNPLAAIKWTLEVWESENHYNKTQFDMIVSELERIDSIVDELLLLAKPETVNYKEQSVLNLLHLIVTLVSIQARKNNIKIIEEIDDELPLVLCDESQIKQVFLNIMKNAIEAMPNGGNLTVQAKLADKNQIVIRFTDEGCGIPAESISKLGEPFYTTKEKGSGLGLMVSHKIILEHHGNLSIESEVNKGTTVEVILQTAPSRISKQQPTA